MGNAGNLLALTQADNDLFDSILRLHSDARLSQARRAAMIGNLLKSYSSMDTLLRLSVSQQSSSLLNKYFANDDLNNKLFMPLLKAYLKNIHNTPPLGHEILKNYQLLFGLRLYHLYKEHGDKRFLELARDYHSFHATEKMVADFIETLENCENKREYDELLSTKDTIISKVIDSCEFHGTPSLILFALLSSHIAKAEHQFGSIEFEYAIREMGIQALMAANSILPYCKRSVDSAYFGLGLAQSNAEGIADLDTAIDNAMKLHRPEGGCSLQPSSLTLFVVPYLRQFRINNPELDIMDAQIGDTAAPRNQSL